MWNTLTGYRHFSTLSIWISQITWESIVSTFSPKPTRSSTSFKRKTADLAFSSRG